MSETKNDRASSSRTPMWRYVYMLAVDNLGRKSKFYGHSHIYYTGQTMDLGARMREHLLGSNSKFLNKNFPDARKVPVYVEPIWGTEYDAMRVEKEVKYLHKQKKINLINGDRNGLIAYVPLSRMIVKMPDGTETVHWVKRRMGQ